MEKKKTSEQNEQPVIDASKMSIYIKLANMRVDLQKRKLTKSGHNNHSNYSYYELSDFLPSCNEIAQKYNTVLIYETQEQAAILTLINCDNTEEQLIFKLPIASINVPGASAMQNIGAVTTYARRYLYMIAFEISENDLLDNTAAEEKRIKEEQTKKEMEEKALKAARTPINAIKINLIKNEMIRTGVSIEAICKRCKVNAIEEITEGEFGTLMKSLKKTPSKQEFGE